MIITETCAGLLFGVTPMLSTRVTTKMDFDYSVEYRYS